MAKLDFSIKLDYIDVTRKAVKRVLEEGDFNKDVSEEYKLGFNEFGKNLLVVLDKIGAEWTSVKDSLPKPFVSVLVYMPDEIPHPTVREGFINHLGKWYAGGYDRLPDEVVMWREMPEPPETKGETE